MTKRMFCSPLLHDKHLACAATTTGCSPAHGAAAGWLCMHLTTPREASPCWEMLWRPLQPPDRQLNGKALLQHSVWNLQDVIKFQWILKQSRLKLRHQSLWPQSSKTLQCMNKATLNSPIGKPVGTTHCFKLGVCSRHLFDVGTVPHSKCSLNQSLNPVYHVVPLWHCWFLTRQSCSLRLWHLHFKSNVKNF